MTGRVSWWSIAFRNLLKQPRRSGFTILAIALGYAAITVFGGFTNYIFTTIQEVQIYLQADGHMTILKPALLENPEEEAQERFIRADELEKLRAIAAAEPAVKIAVPALYFRGLASNGELSMVFMGAGKVWSVSREIQSLATGIVPGLKTFDGRPLEDTELTQVGFGRGLARMLGLSMEGGAILVAPTMDGQINALDVQVVQLSDAPTEFLEKMMVLAPLELAQQLYDTDWVDRFTVVLHRGEDEEAVRARLREALRREGLTSFDVRTWREMDPLSVKVESMFDVIFLFIFSIILLISVLVVVNTTTMTIMERTREIGTLRALGVKRRGILALFARESLLLGLFGSFCGVFLTTLAWWSIRWAELQWNPPQVARPIPLVIYLVPEQLLMALVGMLLICLVAALIPARRASRAGIVDCLGHV